MQVNEAGLALIKAYEGFRSEAYLCPAGIWTVGYGHTTAAGPPPVIKGLRVTRAKADAILKQDVEAFAAGVAARVTRGLNANQFSALVSFAYNVGLSAFATSSVLRAVNTGDFAAVPRRLALWVKAGGKTLAGLVKRRASEGQLFLRPPGTVALFDDVMALPTGHERAEMDAARGLIEPAAGKALAESKTVLSTLGGFASSAAAVVMALKDDVSQALWSAQEWMWVLPERHWPTLMFLAVAGALALFVIRERWRKSEDDGV